jgi:predicted flap endonuclease-1-like 5' DNA nuclease
MAFVEIYWPVFLVALIIGIVVGYLIFRPRQRIRLSEDVPLRPHMTAAAKRSGEGRRITDEAAAAATDVAGVILGARVHDELPGASGPPDDLRQLKGVGPKFAEMLNQRGIIRFDQIAKLSHHQVEALDAAMGPFRGRFARDRIVEQADYLARGDLDGYQAKFGNL